MSRLLVGNLDAESELARVAAPGAAPAALPEAALRRLSAAATLLRVFAAEGDRLWTPRPVDPSRLLPVPGLPCPALLSGPLPAGGKRLTWCSTPAAAGAAARRDGLRDGNTDPVRDTVRDPDRDPDRDTDHDTEPDPEPEPEPEPETDTETEPAAEPAATRRHIDTATARLAEVGPEAPLHERLWHLPASPASVVQRVAHRAFAHELAARLGLARAGTCLLSSVDELVAHLRTGGAAPSPGGAWVLKAPYSAAGRGHVLGVGARLDDASLVRRIERLLASTGVLLFEPWLARVDDWGTCGLVTSDGVELLGSHRLAVDGHGRFRGIDVPAAELTDGERERLEQTARSAGEALAAAGYRGPYGVDACRHRDHSGRVLLEPLIEVNPRMTFGLVARVLAERLLPVLRAPAGVGAGLRLARASRATVPVAAVRLLGSAAADELVAWMELVPARAALC